MKKKLILIIAILMLLAGLGFLLFPMISNTIGSHISKAQTEKYERRVQNIVPDKSRKQAVKDGDIPEDDTETLFKPDLDRLKRDSIAYNKNVRENQATLLSSEEAYRTPVINLTNYGIYDGIYAYVSIPSIDMRLPIYLGANGENMSYGAAHMTYTSLPLGGKRSNCVLAGHTGYIGRIFFDNIRRLNYGDEVIIRNFWSTLTYKVVGTDVGKPNQSDKVYINDDRDLLTMFTCISNGSGGYDRYYVICERKTEKN